MARVRSGIRVPARRRSRGRRVAHGVAAVARAVTAGLVLAILIPFREAIVNAVQNALTSVTSAG